MKLVHLLNAVVFLIFAAVQVNDADWFYWMPIYLAVSGLSIAGFFKRFYPRLTLLLIGAMAITEVRYFPGFLDWLASEDKGLLLDEFAKMQYRYVEETREFLGLLIGLTAMIVLYTKSQLDSSTVS